MLFTLEQFPLLGIRGAAAAEHRALFQLWHLRTFGAAPAGLNTRDRLEKRFPSLHGKLKILSPPGHGSHPSGELPDPSPSLRTAPPATRTAPRRSHLPDRTGPGRPAMGTALPEPAELPEPPGPPPARPGRALDPQPAGRCSSVVLLFCGSVVLWFCSSAVLLFCGSVILLFCSSAVLHFCSPVVLCFCSSVVL